MTTEKKGREFWIKHIDSDIASGDHVFREFPGYDSIHVIEKSDFDALAAENEKLKAELTLEKLNRQMMAIANITEIPSAKSLWDENAALKQKLESLYRQEYGKRNNWAGQWTDCKKCGQLWAFGWNWNDLTHEDECPYCCAGAEIARLKGGRSDTE